MKISDGIWLVFGASGYVGRHLVPHLLSRGKCVRACARRLSALEAEGWEDVDQVYADALDPSTLSVALEGVEVAFYLVHSMGSGRGFPERDRIAARHFAQAAAKAGVRRIVYLGGLAPNQAETEHLASRVETGHILHSGSVPVIELRAGIIIGAGSAAFEVIRDLTAHLPVMVTPHWIRVSSPPIALADLLDDLTALAERSEAEGRVFETGGPERLTYETMMRRLAKALGRRDPIILQVPLLTPQLSSYWLDLVTGVPAPIARALIGGLRHDLTADDASLRQLIPRQCLGFDEAVRLAFESEKSMLSKNGWREGAFDLRGHRHDISFYGKRLSLARDSNVPSEILWQRIEALIKNGERVHVWRQYRVQAGKRAILLSRLFAPGKGGVEITVNTKNSGSQVCLTQHWHPAGVWGLLYWFILWPVRAILWRALLRHLTRSS